MDAALVHHDVRELITETDRLSRRAHAANEQREAEVFASLRTSLLRLDRWLGAPTPPVDSSLIGAVDVFYQRVRDAVARAPSDLRELTKPLVEGALALHREAVRPLRLMPKLVSYLQIPDYGAVAWGE